MFAFYLVMVLIMATALDFLVKQWFYRLRAPNIKEKAIRLQSLAKNKALN